MNARPAIASLDPSRQTKIREANKIAARQSRKRKKEQWRDMELTLDMLMEENRLLTQHHDTLKCWIKQLD
jgi:hypothetical protein